MADERMNLPACPRCSSNRTSVIARSPVRGVWEMYSCAVCFYTWRDIEPDYATKAAAMEAGFRIDPARLREAREMPVIPALRKRDD